MTAFCHRYRKPCSAAIVDNPWPGESVLDILALNMERKRSRSICRMSGCSASKSTSSIVGSSKNDATVCSNWRRISGVMDRCSTASNICPTAAAIPFKTAYRKNGHRSLGQKIRFRSILRSHICRSIRLMRPTT